MKLIPAIIQDANTNKVLMLGYMNEESLAITKQTGKVTFFSRSKNRLWTKGETSGNFLIVKEILTDCDNDTLLIKALVIPTVGRDHGVVCHKGTDTCFGESNQDFTVDKLEAIIENRKQNPLEISYTSSLFVAGINRIAQKVGEEAVELIIESKDTNEMKFLNEAADLFFHYLVLLAAKDKNFENVMNILRQRHR